MLDLTRLCLPCDVINSHSEFNNAIVSSTVPDIYLPRMYGHELRHIVRNARCQRLFLTVGTFVDSLLACMMQQQWSRKPPLKVVFMISDYYLDYPL